jgi:tape measure domain-containing protein
MNAENIINIKVVAKDQASGIFNKIGGSAKNVVGKGVQFAKTAVLGLAASLGAATAAATVFGLRAATDLEQTSVAFKTMLGDAGKAEALLGDLADFAKTTPFELTGIQQSAKQLLAYGFQSEEIIGTLGQLGDVSAGLGVPIQQLGLALGQVKAKTRLAGGEMLQFVNAGVPMRELLSEQLGVAVSEVDDLMSKGLITYDDVAAAFKTMTSEGGRFFNLMDEQSATAGGIISNLKDEFTLFALEVVGISKTGVIEEGGLFDQFKGVLERLLKFINENKDAIISMAKSIVNNLVKGLKLAIEKGRELYDFTRILTEGIFIFVESGDAANIMLANIAGKLGLTKDQFYDVANVLEFTRTVLTKVWDTGVSFANFLGGVFTTVVEGLKLAWDVIQPSVEKLKESFGELMTELEPFLPEIQELGKFLLELGGNILKLLAGAIVIAVAAFVELINVGVKVVTSVVKMGKATENFVLTAIDQFTSFKKRVGEIFGQVKDAITKPFREAKEFIDKTFDDIKNVKIPTPNFFGGNGGNRAVGGRVRVGQPTTVGERGVETFIPDAPGRIVPTSGSGNSNTINVYTQPGEDAVSTAERIDFILRSRLAGV